MKMETKDKKSKVRKIKGPDRKEWLRELASGDAFYYLTIDLVKLFFKEDMDPKSWIPGQSSITGIGRNKTSNFSDAVCRAGDINMILHMDTAPVPDMNVLWDYSAAMIVFRGSSQSEGAQPRRSLLVFITEHSSLEGKWCNRMTWCRSEGLDEENDFEECPTGPNILIIDLENFQKQVSVPESFLEQFLKILAESRTLDEAREAVAAAVEKQYQTGLDEISKEKD